MPTRLTTSMRDKKDLLVVNCDSVARVRIGKGSRRGQRWVLRGSVCEMEEARRVYRSQSGVVAIIIFGEEGGASAHLNVAVCGGSRITWVR
jgi:hypothetical protein